MKYTVYVSNKILDASKTYEDVTEEDINKKIAEFVLDGWKIKPNLMRDLYWDEYNLSKDGWNIALVINWSNPEEQVL